MRPAVRSLAPLLLFPVAFTQAAEWKFDPTLQLRAGYNDNIRLTTDDEVSSAFATFSPSAEFSVKTPRSGASGTLRFDFRRYEEDSNLDDNNTRLNLNSFHSIERSRIGLNFDFIKDTTLDSQLENTGLVFGRVRRERINIGPDWTYFWNTRTSVQASYDYSDVQYKNAGNTGFVNFDLNSFQLSLRHILNERTIMSAALSLTKSSNDNDNDSTNTGIQVGAEYNFSPTVSGSAFVGVRRTEVDFSRTTLIPIFSGPFIIGFETLNENESRSDVGSTFSASINKTFLRGETGLSASRDISNDVNGQPIEVNRLKWLNQYNFTSIFSGNLNIELYNSQTPDSAGNSLDRNYYQFEPRINWRFKKFWRLSGSYRYRKQTFDNTSDDATQNSAYLTLTYLWPRIAVSR